MPLPKLSPRGFAVLAILAVTLLAHAPSLAGGFAMDDRAVAKSTYDDGVPNPMVSELRPLGEYFTSHYWRGHKPTSNLYRPVTVLSYALVYAGFGEGRDEAGEALPQHVVNVLLHVAATAVALLLLRAIGLGWTGSLAGMAVFGVHAIHSEVVAGIVGRAELLAFAGGGAAAWLAVQRGGGGPARAARGAAAAVLFFAAFCSKESAVAWALVPAVLVVARSARAGAGAGVAWRRAAVAVGLALPGLAAFAWLRQIALAEVAGDYPVLYLANPLAWSDAGTRLFSATAYLAFGLYKVVFPLHLACDYGPAVLPLIGSPLDGRFLAAAALLLAILAGGLLAVRRQPALFVAVALFFGLSFLTSNLPFAVGTVFAERLYYAPSLALSFAVAWLVERRAWGRARAVTLAAIAAWSVVSAAVLVDRAAAWRDKEAPFRTDAPRQPRSARLRLAEALLHTDPARRLAGLEAAIALYPEFPEALQSLAVEHARRGDLARAEELFERGLASPHLTWRGPVFDLRFGALSVALDRGRLDAARGHLDAALRLDAAQVAARAPLFIAFVADLARRGKAREARAGLALLAGEARLPADVRARARAELERLR